MSKLADDDKISFKMDCPKKPGSKACDRYEKYKVAKTVGEALRLGAEKGDLKYDQTKGFLKVESQADAAQQEGAAPAPPPAREKSASPANEELRAVKNRSKLPGTQAKAAHSKARPDETSKSKDAAPPPVAPAVVAGADAEDVNTQASASPSGANPAKAGSSSDSPSPGKGTTLGIFEDIHQTVVVPFKHKAAYGLEDEINLYMLLGLGRTHGFDSAMLDALPLVLRKPPGLRGPIGEAVMQQLDKEFAWRIGPTSSPKAEVDTKASPKISETADKKPSPQDSEKPNGKKSSPPYVEANPSPLRKRRVSDKADDVTYVSVRDSVNIEDWPIVIKSKGRASLDHFTTLKMVQEYFPKAPQVLIFVPLAEVPAYQQMLVTAGVGAQWQIVAAPSGIAETDNFIVDHFKQDDLYVYANDNMTEITIAKSPGESKMTRVTYSDFRNVAGNMLQIMKETGISYAGFQTNPSPTLCLGGPRLYRTAPVFVRDVLCFVRNKQQVRISIGLKSDYEKTILHDLHGGGILRRGDIFVERKLTKVGGIRSSVTPEAEEKATVALIKKYPDYLASDTTTHQTSGQIGLQFHWSKPYIRGERWLICSGGWWKKVKGGIWPQVPPEKEIGYDGNPQMGHVSLNFPDGIGPRVPGTNDWRTKKKPMATKKNASAFKTFFAKRNVIKKIPASHSAMKMMRSAMKVKRDKVKHCASTRNAMKELVMKKKVSRRFEEEKRLAKGVSMKKSTAKRRVMKSIQKSRLTRRA